MARVAAMTTRTGRTTDETTCRAAGMVHAPLTDEQPERDVGTTPDVVPDAPLIIARLSRYSACEPVQACGFRRGAAGFGAMSHQIYLPRVSPRRAPAWPSSHPSRRGRGP